MMDNRDNALGLYVSIPFCRSKCTYCNFASGVYPASEHARYVDRLIQDLAAAGEWAIKTGVALPRKVDTVYLGGGTPSLLAPDLLARLFGAMRSQFEETSEALFLTQGYLYDTMAEAEARFKGDAPGFIYSRFANPTVAMFEKRMALLEGAEAARATASGMAAVTAALMGQLKAGDHIVASRALFGSCLYVVEDLLPRFGVASTLVDGLDLDQWKKAVRPNTKVFFLESPTNPTLDVLDKTRVRFAEVIGNLYRG